MTRVLTSGWFVVVALAVIFFLHIAASVGGWYAPHDAFFDVHDWRFNIDKLFHFLGGFWIASAFTVVAAARFDGIDFTKPSLLVALMVVAVVLLAGASWELFEFGLDTVFATSGPLRQQVGLADTMGDLFFDLLGGAVFAMLLAAGTRANSRAR